MLAVDPTSPFTGGALLGDRLRMQEHATDPGVFIRSMATRGHLGGLAWAVPHALRVLDAAGADVIVLETVGVGQAEVEVAHAADTTIVVLAPGMGDSVQANKAGILEIADIFVVNKADKPGAGETTSASRRTGRRRSSRRRPRVAPASTSCGRRSSGIASTSSPQASCARAASAGSRARSARSRWPTCACGWASRAGEATWMSLRAACSKASSIPMRPRLDLRNDERSEATLGRGVRARAQA